MKKSLFFLAFLFFATASFALTETAELSGTFFKMMPSSGKGATNYYLDTLEGKCRKQKDLSKMGGVEGCVQLNLSRIDKINGIELSIDMFKENLNRMEERVIRVKGQKIGQAFLVQEINF